SRWEFGRQMGLRLICCMVQGVLRKRCMLCHPSLLLAFDTTKTVCEAKSYRLVTLGQPSLLRTTRFRTSAATTKRVAPAIRPKKRYSGVFRQSGGVPAVIRNRVLHPLKRRTNESAIQRSGGNAPPFADAPSVPDHGFLQSISE